MSELEQLRKEVNELRERLALAEMRLSQQLSLAPRQAPSLWPISPFQTMPYQPYHLTCLDRSAP